MNNDIELDKAIDDIIQNGLQKPKTLYAMLRDVIVNVGIKNVFAGMGSMIIIFFLTLFLGVILFFVLITGDAGYMSIKENNRIIVSVFTLSPFVYVFLNVISYLEEKKSNTYEVIETCLYNVPILLGLRTFLFSVFTLIFNLFFLIFYCNTQNGLSLFTLIGVSACSLLLSSLINLEIMRKKDKKVLYIMASVLWLILNVSLYIFVKGCYGYILSLIPPVIYYIISIGMLVIFLKKIKRLMLNMYRKEVFI